MAERLARVGYEIQRRFLERVIRPGDHVLDVSSGAGRSTVQLLDLGADVTLAAGSSMHIELVHEAIGAAGITRTLKDEAVVDLRERVPFEDHTFDAVVCLGDALSATCDQFDHAVRELARITVPGGVVVVNVMSLLGNARHFLNVVPQLIEDAGLDAYGAMLADGDGRRVAIAEGPEWQMFTASSLRQRVERLGCEVLHLSANGFLALGDRQALSEIGDHPDWWAALVDWEVWACEQPGALDGGTSILAALRAS